MMTVRGFVACYLGIVLAIGAAGASTFHALQRRHAAEEAAAATSVVVAAAAPQSVTPALAPAAVPAAKATETSRATQVPHLRPRITVEARTAFRHPLHVQTAKHLPLRRPAVVAVVRNDMPMARPARYAALPPRQPPVAGYSAYPAYPAYAPYGAYSPYYPTYRYYRSF
jgi:hypothetical protein